MNWYQRLRRRLRSEFAQYVLFILLVGAGLVFLNYFLTAPPPYSGGVFGGVSSPLEYDNFYGGGAILELATIAALISTAVEYVQLYFRHRRRDHLIERIERLQEKFARLAEEEPMLALALQIMWEEQAIITSEGARKSFRQGIVQNCIFFILGVVTPLLLAKLRFG